MCSYIYHIWWYNDTTMTWYHVVLPSVYSRATLSFSIPFLKVTSTPLFPFLTPTIFLQDRTDQSTFLPASDLHRYQSTLGDMLWLKRMSKPEHRSLNPRYMTTASALEFSSTALVLPMVLAGLAVLMVPLLLLQLTLPLLLTLISSPSLRGLLTLVVEPLSATLKTSLLLLTVVRSLKSLEVPFSTPTVSVLLVLLRNLAILNLLLVTTLLLLSE